MVLSSDEEVFGGWKNVTKVGSVLPAFKTVLRSACAADPQGFSCAAPQAKKIALPPHPDGPPPSPPICAWLAQDSNVEFHTNQGDHDNRPNSLLVRFASLRLSFLQFRLRLLESRGCTAASRLHSCMCRSCFNPAPTCILCCASHPSPAH